MTSGFTFTAKTADGLYPPGVTFSAQFQITTTPATTAPDVRPVQCKASPDAALAPCTFNTPMGVVARNGIIYVADTASHAVYKVDSFSDTAQKVLIAGLQIDPLDAPEVRYNGDGIDARQALLNNPTGLALDEEESVHRGHGQPCHPPGGRRRQRFNT